MKELTLEQILKNHRLDERGSVRARFIITLTLLAVTFVAGFLLGADNEYRTHALKVSRITGASYARLVSPTAILSTHSTDLDDAPAGDEGQEG